MSRDLRRRSFFITILYAIGLLIAYNRSIISPKRKGLKFETYQMSKCLHLGNCTRVEIWISNFILKPDQNFVPRKLYQGAASMKTEARMVPRQAEGLELTKAMNLERWDFRTKSTFHRIVSGRLKRIAKVIWLSYTCHRKGLSSVSRRSANQE